MPVPMGGPAGILPRFPPNFLSRSRCKDSRQAQDSRTIGAVLSQFFLDELILDRFGQNTRAKRLLRLSSMMNVLPCPIDFTGHAFWPL
jgi:hypothetical protein